MHQQKISYLGKNKISRSENSDGRKYSKNEVVSSWKDAYVERVARGDEEIGLRPPQYGALSAIRAHWTISSLPATIVMPTGTGKSATIFTTIISERILSTLIIVPSNLLRDQMFEGGSKLEILHRLEMVSEDIIFPNTILYKSRPGTEDTNNLVEEIREANIIISTPTMINGLPPEALDELIKQVEVVIFDEAHHLAAPDWSAVRGKFIDKKILQFTATPFRNDGQRVDGEIIFNYPLALAQKAGYFKPIDFYPIQEFSEAKSDEEIARVAVNLLKKDLGQGFNHILLARAKSVKRANELYKNIYSKYEEFNPLCIHSRKASKMRKNDLELLKAGKAQIVVCVDMFGEGIDIPTLKIAAIHDKFKSMPITLQFIGRFTRTSNNNLGNAKLVTNVGLEDLKEEIDNLYQQDSDWNQLLHIQSNKLIQNEINLNQFINNFDKNHNNDIDISQIKMRVSTRIFRPKSLTFKIDKWKDVLDSERTIVSFNNQDSIYIFIEQVEKTPTWTNQKDILQYDYDFFVIFLDKQNGLVHINETDASKGNRLIEKIFDNPMLVKGESTYRALAGINRLMIGTLGLKQVPNGRISFRMFAGTDIKSGINQAVISGSTKSNLFGYGYQNGKYISIGCSYKGKIWMRWSERVIFWMEWCREIGRKVLDETIDTQHILENSLVLETIKKFPDGVPYKISLTKEMEVSNSIAKQLSIANENELYPFFQVELKNPKVSDAKLIFELWINDRMFLFEQSLTEISYAFKQIGGNEVFVKNGNQLLKLSEYFYDHAPEITFIQDSGVTIVVQDNLQTVIKPKQDILLNPSSLIAIDWENKYGTDIKVESQDRERKSNSIQYATIHNIVNQDSDIIFDDDGSGEIADVVAVKIDHEMNKISFYLYHCKYSGEDKPGARVGDLYEVCGQAEKSIIWNDNVINIIERMIKREQIRQENYNDTRFEKGNIETLNILKKMIKSGYDTEFNVAIVQPGVSIAKLSDSMKQIILATDTYLKETYQIELKCYFSQ